MENNNNPVCAGHGRPTTLVISSHRSLLLIIKYSRVTARTNTQPHFLLSFLFFCLWFLSHRKQVSAAPAPALPGTKSEKKCIPNGLRHKRSIKRVGWHYETWQAANYPSSLNSQSNMGDHPPSNGKVLPDYSNLDRRPCAWGCWRTTFGWIAARQITMSWSLSRQKNLKTIWAVWCFFFHVEELRCEIISGCLPLLSLSPQGLFNAPCCFVEICIHLINEFTFEWKKNAEKMHT